jgi:hypothetical protein
MGDGFCFEGALPVCRCGFQLQTFFLLEPALNGFACGSTQALLQRAIA